MTPIREPGGLGWNCIVPNFKEYDLEGIGNALFSLNVYVCFVLALDVLQGDRVVGGGAGDAICEARFTPTHITANVKRDGSDRNCFIAV